MPGMTSLSWGIWPMMSAPLIGCVFMTSNSSFVRAVGFLRMRSSMPILPTSCRRAERRMIRTSSAVSPMWRARTTAYRATRSEWPRV